MTAPMSSKVKATTLGFKLNLRAALGWAAILGFIALVLGGLAAHAGSLMQMLYPLAALVVGLLLYWRYPVLYLGFAWWLWLLTPEVRRVVDYQSAWEPENPVMLAPILVTALAGLTVLRYLPMLQFTRFFPFALIFSGLFYGYVVGIYKTGMPKASADLLYWIVPVVLAFHIMLHWRSYPQYRRAIQRTFVWGVFVVGAYGLVQFFWLPDWDRNWMENAPIASIGAAEPSEFRVFSTLNSPGPFAMVMMAGLLLLFNKGGVLRWPAAVAGYATFLLSLVRSVWGGWVVALLFIITTGRRLRLRLLLSLGITLLVVWPLLTIGPIAEIVNERLLTIADLEQDESLQDRLEFLGKVAPLTLQNPVGEGMGSTGLATKLGNTGGDLGEFGNFDSGIMNIPFTLGWPGSLLLVSGVVWLLYDALRGGGSKPDLFVEISGAIAIAVLIQLIFVNTLIGVQGMVFWSFLSLAAIGRTYNQYSK